jgi:hypothetical protein
MQPKSWQWYALPVAVTMIPVAFALGIWVKATPETWSSIGVVGQWASALLPLIAIGYAYQQTRAAITQSEVSKQALEDTRKSADEARRAADDARKDAVAPYLALRPGGHSGGPEPNAYGYLEFDLLNAGNGPAIAIDVSCLDLRTGQTHTLAQKAALATNECATVRIQPLSNPMSGNLTVKYYSRHGHPYSEVYEFREYDRRPTFWLTSNGQRLRIS